MIHRFVLGLIATTMLAGATSALAGTTGIAGQGQSFNNRAPSLAVAETVTLQGIFPPRNLTLPGSNSIGGDDFIASIHMFAGNYAPQGTANAYGQTLSIAQNYALYALVGNYYGGNGQTTFQLPNTQGRSLVGAGQDGGLAFHGLGESYGAATAALTVANLPSHTHSVPGGQTTAVGGGQAYDVSKPSLAITYAISDSGMYPVQGSGSTGDNFFGQVEAFAGNFAPQGWLVADGSTLNVSEHAALFSLLGTTYGGNGTTTFALPDLRGRSAVGVGAVSGGSQITLGEVFGSESHTLTSAQMPAHEHTIGGGNTGIAGASQPIDEAGPSLGLNYIIDVAGLYPTHNLTLPGAGMGYGANATLGEISLFAGNFAPAGWMICNGQLLSITQNIALFSLLGTAYGGNGTTDFALPDFRGRTAVGAGSFGGQGISVGDQLGQANISLTEANLPAHDHGYTPLQSDVPEPASWAMMISGFGLVGAAARRTRRAVNFAV